MTAPDTHSDDITAREPYFAVIPTADYLRRNLTPERERAFFAGGEALVAWMFSIIEPITPGFAPVAVLDYGCGLGRLSRPLAKRAGSITAVDRSRALLDAAREGCATRNIGNVEFELASTVLASSRQFDLVICYETLQRMRPDDGIALMKRLIKRIGPGGVGVFHFPYDDKSSMGVQALRELRQRIPAANRLANRMRGKDADEPFVPTFTYPLNTMLDELRTTSMGTTHVVLDQQSGTARATVFVWMPYEGGATRPTSASAGMSGDVAEEISGNAGANASGMIDVRELIKHASIDELNRTAEEYFSTLVDWEHHLAKPFAKPDEVPPLLIDVAMLVQGLRLQQDMSVLEYGSGSGWLSRYFTQLGCQAILLDVAPTALKMAEELYTRQPVIGHRPTPQFLLFDGRHINLPDNSVDRIVCYHAFHHAANPDEVLKEFGRVLKPGGIAAFAEPGPAHSRSPRSQFEMRTYHVVENDVDVHAIWRTARACGFSDIKLGLFHEPSYHVSLMEYENLLTGGHVGEKWLAQTRRFLRNVRTFFLYKEGGEPQNSKSIEGLSCEIVATLVTPTVSAGETIIIDATVTNTGPAIWLPWPERGGVALGTHLYDGAGALLNFDLHCTAVILPPRNVMPGETVTVHIEVPPLAPGRYQIELDCVASGVTWFTQVGSQSVTLPVEVI